MVKIIQIATQYIDENNEASIIGLSATGEIYYWGNKPTNVKEGKITNHFGWILMVDELN